MIMIPKTTFIPGPVGKLEAIITQPKLEPGEKMKGFMVICHPNPLSGGTMHNKVVTTIAKACERLAIPTIRFNFRGTQGSDGEHDGGKHEIFDLLAAIAWGNRNFGESFGLAGFSFGAYVCAETCYQVKGAITPRCLITVSPCIDKDAFVDPSVVPDFNRNSLREIDSLDCPWLLTMGEEDEIVKPEAVFDFVEQSSADIELVRMPNTSHFYHGKLIELRETVMTFLTDCFV